MQPEQSRRHATLVGLKAPYLILIGDVQDPLYAKTGAGLVHWRRDRVAGQLRFASCPVDLGVPDMSIAQAEQAGVGSLVIGVAPVGGVVPDPWWDAIVAAARAGLDIVSGLHLRLADFPALREAARVSGAALVDVRVPPKGLPVGTGRKRRGKRVLTVGTDCAVGKKYTALALEQALRAAGMSCTFRATGQTGIMIAGSGMPIDAVVSDFVAGAAEVLSPDNDPEHWDVIEGQGSLFHPGYASVSLGLLHGSQPDAIVLCHDPSRTQVSAWESYALPSVSECIQRNLLMGRLTNPHIRCVGVSVNTARLPEEQRQRVKDALSEEAGLPCVDPIADGMGAIAEALCALGGQHHGL